MTTSFTTCDVCGKVLDLDKGEAFLTDDGGTYCADDYEVPEDDFLRRPDGSIYGRAPLASEAVSPRNAYGEHPTTLF